MFGTSLPRSYEARTCCAVGASKGSEKSRLANNAKAMFTIVEGGWDEVMFEAERWWRAA